MHYNPLGNSSVRRSHSSPTSPRVGLQAEHWGHWVGPSRSSRATIEQSHDSSLELNFVIKSLGEGISGSHHSRTKSKHCPKQTRPTDLREGERLPKQSRER